MPALTTTVGFEAEYHNNVGNLGRHLYAEGLAPTAELHRWHCDCDTCTNYDDDTYGFHLQNDSSCGGEVISRVIGTTDDLVSLTEALQAAAFAVDAEPGLTAGFHVHVKPHRYHAVKHACLWNYLRWEQTLLNLAAGPFARYRGGLNTIMSDQVYLYRNDGHAGSRAMNIGDFEFDEVDWGTTYETAYDMDRHSTLNLHGGPGTWEFRLWNSTRAAWRMQMYAGLAAAFVNKDFAAILNDEECPGSDYERNFTLLATALDLAGYGATAEQVNRQAAYLARNDVPSSPVFTR